MDFFSYPGSSRKIKGRGVDSLALEWEEGAAVSDMATSGSQNKPRRLWILPGLITLVSLGFVSRLFWLQLYQAGKFTALADNNRIRERVLLAPRGLITDRGGEVLADNTARFRLSVYPVDVPRDAREVVAEKLAEVSGRHRDELLEILVNKKNATPDVVVLLDNMTPEARVSAASQITDLPGVALEAVPTRAYKYPPVFSHALGYTGQVTQKELPELLKKGYSRADVVGKSGVEAFYEEYLKGINGAKRLEVDAGGKVISDLGESGALVGNTLELEIDSGLQKRLYESLSARGELGAAVAIDPRSGAVLALVSLPGFDTNALSIGLGQEDGDKIFSDPLKPLFNRAISGTYPPGSTVKPMVASAALNESLITDATTIVDKGFLSIPNRYNPSIIYNFYGWKRDGLGPLNVYGAVARSSDIYFYVVGGGHPLYPNLEGLGVSRLAQYYRAFGLGKKLGIDLPGEAPGLVPDPAWKEKYFEGDEVMQKWYLGDTYHLSIGQGDLLVTPLQAAFWTSVIANNGVGFAPSLLRKVKDLGGRIIYESEKKEIVRPKIKPEVLKIAQNSMRQAVLTGGAKSLLTLPITSAGKTGTSQFDGADPSRTHAWFTVYAPFENPEIAIAVLVEAGGEGHAAALPTAKEALEWWARMRYCKQETAVCDLKK